MATLHLFPRAPSIKSGHLAVDDRRFSYGGRSNFGMHHRLPKALCVRGRSTPKTIIWRDIGHPLAITSSQKRTIVCSDKFSAESGTLTAELPELWGREYTSYGGVSLASKRISQICQAKEENWVVPARINTPSSPELLDANGRGSAVYDARESEKQESTGAAPIAKTKTVGSNRLNRWARTRQLRSGSLRTKTAIAEVEEVVDSPHEAKPLPRADSGVRPERDSGDLGQDSDVEDPAVQSKGIYIISDGTGWTADNAVQAALGQFEHCFVDHGCPVHTHLYSQVDDVERLLEIIRTAGEDNCSLVVYTLADPAMRDAAMEACQVMKVPFVDMMGSLIAAVEGHLGATPMGLPRGAPGRKSQLTRQYFKRIEAVEFTIRQDDGALPRNLRKADLVLAGVSRTSKTPLSTYLAQKGYKVANVPLVFGIPPPKELFEIDQSKIFGLTINPATLRAIRSARYDHLGLNSVANGKETSGEDEKRSSPRYHDPEHIRRELEHSHQLFRENPRWTVIDVTGRAIEETAAVILRFFHEKPDHKRMPRISRRY